MIDHIHVLKMIVGVPNMTPIMCRYAITLRVRNIYDMGWIIPVLVLSALIHPF